MSSWPRNDPARLGDGVGCYGSEGAGIPQWPLVKHHEFPLWELITIHKEGGAGAQGSEMGSDTWT